MLTDPFGRQIVYLRISVTDKCNFRCTYCMPHEGVVPKPHSEILRYEQIRDIVSVAAGLGISKVRITGGEPLVKRNLEQLVEYIAATAGVRETCMTTNGSLLTAEKAHALKRAGLNRVNISLDTLDRDRFREITRCGSYDDVLRGIDAALAADLRPVKINMLIFDHTTNDELEDMHRFAEAKGVVLQTIRHFSLHERNGSGGCITDRPTSCASCNRLRLTADGFLKPCLFSDKEIRVDFNDIRASILSALAHKPESGESCRNRHMSQIGG